jgi:hypothetical protein
MRDMAYETEAERCRISPPRSALGILSYSLCCPPHMESAMTAAIQAAMRENETGLNRTDFRQGNRIIRLYGPVQDNMERAAHIF